MIKVKTNLTPKELSTIGRGLVKLAKQQSESAFSAENSAEEALILDVRSLLTKVTDSLRGEINKIFVK
jgi:hypothetical protein